MAAGADDGGGPERPVGADDPDPVRFLGDGGHPRALTDVHAGGARAIEQIIVELPAENAVAGRAPPARLGARAVELEAAGRESLDRERILLRVDLRVGQRLGSDPAGAHLHPWKDRRVQQERAQPRTREPPRRGAAARTAADHDDVVLDHRQPRQSVSSMRTRSTNGTRSSSIEFAMVMASKRSPSRSIEPST